MDDPELVIGRTRRWVERAVIGLGLCPFARAVYVADRVRFVVAPARTAADLLEALRRELALLQRTDPAVCDTTLLIHPGVLDDFLEFNDFLELCEATVRDMGFEGELQVASFHPRFQFAGTRPDDIENHTNRSPYPTLHLLREASIERALDGVADPDSIYQANISRLRGMGLPGWQALWVDDLG